MQLEGVAFRTILAMCTFWRTSNSGALPEIYINKGFSANSSKWIAGTGKGLTCTRLWEAEGAIRPRQIGMTCTPSCTSDLTGNSALRT